MDLMTVTGAVSPDKLGVILPHEHLFIDLRNQFTEFQDPEKNRLSRESVEIHNLARCGTILMPSRTIWY